MTARPTTGATENVAVWASRPALAKLVRVVLFVAPIVVGWLAIRAAAWAFYRPDGWTGTALWVVQAIIVASTAAHGAKLVAQRLAPVSALLNLTMVFPDHAPSRFGVVLRSGNLKKLTPEQLVLSEDRQEAAEQAMALVAALSAHEPRTRGHTERVRAYAELIGEEMGLSDDELNRLRWGVLLHDVGKLKVPAHILNSKDAPTKEQWEILKTHPLEGQKILKPLQDWLGEWALVSLHHHERWDGGGYPAGLEGTEISLGGRIASVADAYDVISSHRSYKQPMSPEAARQELVRCAGEQFDPDVVRAFLQIGLTDRRRSAGLLGWLFELPTVIRVTSSAATATPSVVSATATAAAAVSVSVASIVGTGSVERPPVLAFEDPPSIVVEDVGEVVPQEPTTTAAPTTTSTTAAPTTTSTTAPTSTTAAPTTTIPPAGPGPGAENEAITVTKPGDRRINVLDNDTPTEDPIDPSTLEIVVAPVYAEEYRVHGNHIHYKRGDVGVVDSLVYEICDTEGRCAQATVTITVPD